MARGDTPRGDHEPVIDYSSVDARDNSEFDENQWFAADADSLGLTDEQLAQLEADNELRIVEAQDAAERLAQGIEDNDDGVRRVVLIKRPPGNFAKIAGTTAGVGVAGAAVGSKWGLKWMGHMLSKISHSIEQWGLDQVKASKLHETPIIGGLFNAFAAWKPVETSRTAELKQIKEAAKKKKEEKAKTQKEKSLVAKLKEGGMSDKDAKKAAEAMLESEAENKDEENKDEEPKVPKAPTNSGDSGTTTAAAA